jgi:hypothetical protein
VARAVGVAPILALGKRDASEVGVIRGLGAQAVMTRTPSTGSARGPEKAPRRLGLSLTLFINRVTAPPG